MASNIADFISWAVEYIFLEAGRMEEEKLEKWIRAFRGDRQLKEYVVEYIEGACTYVHLTIRFI